LLVVEGVYKRRANICDLKECKEEINAVKNSGDC
jgi:hypothetical protein